ncbi:hypothetical protein ACFQZ0_13675 [Streptomyces erythrogriseus]|uniref:Uncharacterized protein n=3 Tax=Streptomyces TaxID=1883 RepID=A0ABN3WLH7_9ACTN|nr:hypothetical protein [Streptomyces vinaceus]GGP51085.1 hypothetical protein GCM10010265_31410 [Streptomyces griseoincarnatus]GGT64674.1 hypothetical protein GCM10010287_44080 [Streptomyces variabilis]
MDGHGDGCRDPPTGTAVTGDAPLGVDGEEPCATGADVPHRAGVVKAPAARDEQPAVSGL